MRKSYYPTSELGSQRKKIGKASSLPGKKGKRRTSHRGDNFIWKYIRRDYREENVSSAISATSLDNVVSCSSKRRILKMVGSEVTMSVLQ